jgi:molybdenum cofactor synthesis domain-containing protein
LADNNGILKTICISERRGTPKYRIAEADIVKDWGIGGDAHGGKWHRQISLLAYEEIQKFREKGAEVEFGAFGENLVVEGLDLGLLPIGTRMYIGETAVIELTQRGKECHNHCEIYKRMGDCIMPKKGVFAEVIKGGHIKEGDDIKTELPSKDNPFTAAVITLSDKGYRGEREDLSGPLVADIVTEAGYRVTEALLLPDDKEWLKKELIRLSDGRQISLILTTGGTGFSERDVTPEATIEVCDRLARGIPEAMRAYSMTITKRAMLSRAEAGIRGKTLIVNLPGSPKAVRESLGYILPELNHGLAILRGTENECGGK